MVAAYRFLKNARTEIYGLLPGLSMQNRISRDGAEYLFIATACSVKYSVVWAHQELTALPNATGVHAKVADLLMVR